MNSSTSSNQSSRSDVNDEGLEHPSKKSRSGFRLRKLVNIPFDHRRTNDEVHSRIEISPVMNVIIDTPPMQRLRGIKQLGTSEYVYMNTNHNRFEHSLGVAYLAGRMCRRIRERQPALGCTEKDILCVKLAGLMHDIGHGPYSHVYEQFIETLKEHLDAHPELERHYENLPTLPDGWRHECVSLMMIDAVLEHLGLQIDLNNLDAPLKQIGDGIDAASLAELTYGKTLEECVLTSRDFVFIKECIWGGPIPEVIEQMGNEVFIGRQATEQEWLYDIVCNRHSGLDVDKVDYFARDERRAIRGAGEAKINMIDEAVVAWAKCATRGGCARCKEGRNDGRHLMICYPEKMIEPAKQFFAQRFYLHTNIYRHKTVAATAFMLCDILCMADPYFLIPTRSGLSNRNSSAKSKLGVDALPISRAMLHPVAFCALDDTIIDRIMWSSDENLKPAQALIWRLKYTRDLYKCVAKRSLDMNMPHDRRLWEVDADEIKKGMLMMNGTHLIESGMRVALSTDDIIVEHCQIHQGKKDKNPLCGMRFLSKPKLSQLVKTIENLPEAEVIREERGEGVFQKNSIRIFCREPSKADLARHVFAAWLTEFADEAEMTYSSEGDLQPTSGEQANILTQESVEGGESDSDEEDESIHDYFRSPRPKPSGSSRITPPRKLYSP